MALTNTELQKIYEVGLYQFDEQNKCFTGDFEEFLYDNPGYAVEAIKILKENLLVLANELAQSRNIQLVKPVL